MKLQYLGTGAGYGVPEIFCHCRMCTYARQNKGKDVRTRSQAIIDDRFSIDFSVDVFTHGAFYDVDTTKIKNVIVTHGHHDHFFTNDIFTRALGAKDPITFYCPEITKDSMQKKIDAEETSWESGRKPKHQGANLKAVKLQFYTPVLIDGFTVTPLKARHAHNIGAMIFVIQKDGKNILWAHDTGLLHTEVYEYLKNIGIRFDLVSLDCTLKRGEQISLSHMDADWCIETKNRLVSQNNADDKTIFVLSHIGHLVDRTHKEMEDEMKEHGFIVAYDTMTVEL